MTRLSVSACLIAKDEREHVEPCLTSFVDHVDELVFVDTGSRDGTVAEVRRVCRRHGWTDKLVLGRFKWCDDFAAARNHAASLAGGDIHVWVDLDDRIVGAEHIPEVARAFERKREVRRASCAYRSLGSSSHTPDRSAPWREDARERFFRAPVRWACPTWERVEPLGEPCPWFIHEMWWWHHKTRPRGRRDLNIALSWHKREPDNALALEVITSEALACQVVPLAIAFARRAVDHPAISGAKRAIVLPLLAKALFADEQCEEAERIADEAIEIAPSSLPLVIIARCAVRRGAYAKALKAALAIESLRSFVPLQDRVVAGLAAAVAADALGEYELGIRAAERTLALLPEQGVDELRARLSGLLRGMCRRSPAAAFTVATRRAITSALAASIDRRGSPAVHPRARR